MIYRVLVFYPSSPSLIGLWQPDAVLPWQTVTLQEGVRGADLLAAVYELLGEHKLDLSQLTHLGAMTGPASYTQLRTMVATANALAWSLRIPLFGFNLHSQLPHDLPSLLTMAHVNKPLEPVYLHELK